MTACNTTTASFRRYSGRLVVLAAILCAAGLASAAPARAADLSVSAQPALYPAFDPAVTDYVTRCTPGGPVVVTVSAPASTTVDVAGQGPRSGDFTTDVTLAVNQSFRIDTASGGGAAAYYVRCLPADFPAWTFQRLGTPQAEWYVVAPFARTDFQAVPPGVSQTYGAIFDGNGVPVWWLKSSQSGLDVKVLSNGDFAFAHAFGVEERTLNGALVRMVKAGAGSGTDSHEVLLLPNGNYLIAAGRVFGGQDVCGKTGVSIVDNGAEEITPGGSVVWSWWASEHISLSETPSVWCNSFAADAPLDIFHINSVEPDGDGYLMSFRHLDAVYRINASDGSIDWKLGGTATPESLTVSNDALFAAEDGLRGQHDARRLGDGTVTVHDNGFHPGSTRAPRAVRFDVDPVARTATLVEQADDPGGVGTPLCCGSARKLTGGDWLMSWGSSGLVTELTSSGSRVFSLTFDDQLFSYRAQALAAGTVSRESLRAGMDAQYRFQQGYARPKGAPLLWVSLVPGYDQCTAPDRVHAPPLAFGSCSSPRTESLLTIGTPDANQERANGSGSVAYVPVGGNRTTPENEADLRIRADLTDVRQRSDLSDYTGEVQLRGSIRITDRFSGPSRSDSATGLDTEFPAAIPCVATADPGVGASCSLSTSVNAISPGAVVEGHRANWELGPVQIFDGGAGGAAGAVDARLFERQGVFTP